MLPGGAGRPHGSTARHVGAPRRRPPGPSPSLLQPPSHTSPLPFSTQDEYEFEDELGLDEEEAEYAQWAAEAESEFGSLEEAYQDFAAQLGRDSRNAATPGKPKRGGRARGGLAAVGGIRDAVPQRPRGAPAQVPAPPAGRVQLQLSQLARPPKLAAKPQASVEARAAAQPPLPPPPPPEPKLASKPSRPAAPAPLGGPVAPPPPPPKLARRASRQAGRTSLETAVTVQGAPLWGLRAPGGRA